MTTIYTATEPLDRSVFDAYCALEPGYREKFLFIERERRVRVAGLGSVFAEEMLAVLPHEFVGSVPRSPVLFVAGVFDPDDAKPKNSLFRALEGSAYVLPEVVLIEEDGRTYIQVNSAVPIDGDLARRLASAPRAAAPVSADIPYTLILDSKQEWFANVAEALRRIRAHEFDKVVLARELRVETETGFTSRQMVANLLASRISGTLILHEVDGVFFIGVTPELLVRKKGDIITTMCLAGTVAAGESERERLEAAEFLLHDPKNLREHAYVVEHLAGSLAGVCSSLTIPERPTVLTLKYLQHLCTPVQGTVDASVSLIELRNRLHPTPALAGSPVDRAKAAIRETESFNRGFYGGPFGYVDFEGNGQFSVAIRSGVFSHDYGYVYAGCGIVEGSDPATEYDEIDVKLKTILSAFQGVHDE